MKPTLVVVGSINLDMVARVTRAPEAGETLPGRSMDYVPGGKGANQAVAAARLGATVRMVARVGDDPFGPSMRDNLHANGVDTEFVLETKDTPTGAAIIFVEDSGENRIVITAGSNGALQPDDVDRARSAFNGASMVLLQNEVSLEATVYAARVAKEAGAVVLWNPAPAPEGYIPDTFLLDVDILVPNETEAERLSGIPVRDLDMARRAANTLIAKGVDTVVITLGERGALWYSRTETFTVPARTVDAVDTTAAGDTFAGALAVALAEGQKPREAVSFACAAASLAVTRLGAQAGIPTRAELEHVLVPTV